ncbi:MAG: Ig-like domain-containing protein, partial [Lachnospiraceae bacterium]|nr:Ig-like domain-containing protein [Lachnospiraceae bacterium]
MRKIGRTRQHIRYVSCMIAAVIGLLQPCAALAVEEANTEVVQEEGTEEGASEGNAVNYITAFEKLAEEDAYFPCMYKPSLEELVSAFPETLSAWIDEGATLLELEVTWECEEDFDATLAESYVFYPQWDDVSYPIADSVKDNIEIPLIRVEVLSGNNVISNLEEAKNGLQGILQRKNILALVYLCDKYEVKQEPSYDSGTIHTVVCGQSVQIIDVEPNAYGSVWYQVLFYRNETAYKGYIEKEYLATSDEDFAEWENTYLDLSALPSTMTSDDGYPDVDQFPASYQNALYALKQKHPNWIFVRMDTGIDWATAIEKELGDKSLVPSKSSGSWQNGTYGQGWSYASEGILKYYMDPRNFLTDPEIFQFEQLTFNSSYHTTTAVQEVLKNSFMSSTIPGDSQTYAQAFTGIGQNLGVSPFHLASRVLQEQGTKGSSALISGTYAGYEGYYNYFNVGASGKTDKEVVQSGLKRAISEGWNTRYKSLYGGAAIIGAKYILQGQDTLYLEKFNVSNGGYPNFTHQYMQNIQAPSSESVNIRKAYNNAGALENSFVFKIPVYLNMPASACSKPETTDAITLDKTAIDSLEVNKTVVLIPYVNGSKVDYVSNMTFASSNPTVADVDSQGKVTAKSPGTTTISCTRKGANTATCTVTVIKANPTVSTPVLSPRTYQDGLKLSDIALPDGWEWTNAGTKIGVGTFSYPALYTPEDTTKYNTVTKEISFTITKAIPNCQMPEKLEAKTGMVLGEIELPNGFTWESNVETELKEAGEFTFYVSYNPDEKNYYTVEHIPIIVHVIKSKDDQDDNNGNTSSGSTSSGSTSSGSTSNGSTSSGSTSNGSTSNGSTSSGSTSSGSTSSGSTSSGSTATARTATARRAKGRESWG